MTQEEKQLLLTDLCARLPYGVKCAIFDNKLPFGGAHGEYPFEMDAISIEENEIDVWLEKGNFNIETIKPYLRPMPSMTDNEREDWYRQSKVDYDCEFKPEPTLSPERCHLSVDWLNKYGFDYRGLIPMGLALEAPEGMYKK